MTGSGAPPSLWGKVPVPFGRLPHKARHLAPEAIQVSGVSSVAQVNSWANNNITYKKDIKDAWNAPAVTLADQFGDCEDIAIVKHAMLNHLQIPSWVAIVKDRMRGRRVSGRWLPGYHAVTVTQNLVLDLHSSKPLPIEGFIDYIPVIAFDFKHCWLYGKPVGVS